ncbi:alpha/beta hydrolase [Alteromonas halophila]|uniref:BD-FAE-like domain-containing protein n=1 Tax=Alteromonas halophila TaxID=516698 RepID=A0A918JJZ8_9ALTE|nr:alpha/beta hydrolase [Alteromonas halophila]GGW79660.1 hypothetical protein GCM10007391_10570 [Alteromonas halophila]
MFKFESLIIIALLFISNVAMANEEKYTGLHTDIPIGQIAGTQLSINIAFPTKTSKKASPVILFIHGGGFVSGSKDTKNQQLRNFSKRGYVAASAMYRLAPKHKFPSQIEDIQLAIRFLKANAVRYHLDPDKIIVAGSSAGGYLAVMAGVTGNSDAFSDHGLFSSQNSVVRAVIAQSPPIADFTLPTYQNSLAVQRLADPATTDIQKTLVNMTPATYLDPNDPPFFLSHGSKDPLVPVQMSREFVEELNSIKHDYVYYEVEGGTHSLTKSAPQKAKMVFSELVKFIEKWSGDI